MAEGSIGRGVSPVMAFKKSAVQPQPAVVSGTNRPPAHCGGFASSLARNSFVV